MASLDTPFLYGWCPSKLNQPRTGHKAHDPEHVVCQSEAVLATAPAVERWEPEERPDEPRRTTHRTKWRTYLPKETNVEPERVFVLAG